MASEEPPSPAYRTKHIHFFGRSTPIILQNDNGPCPLIAICNLLLLRKSLDLGECSWKVPVSKLLTLLAEKLIDSSSKFGEKEIGDAIDLLPRLATGINVDVRFRRINDFEFTRERTIFDLLGIDLYHGWLVDPQDTDTAAAIGSKSYNTVVGELVSFDAKRLKEEDSGTMEKGAVDFSAASEVPSQCLSRRRRGDEEEEAEVMRALNQSQLEILSPVNMESSGSGNHAESFVAQDEKESVELEQPDFISPQRCNGVHSQLLPSTETDPLSTNTSTEMPPYSQSTNKEGSVGSYTCEGQRTCSEDFVTSETVQNQADNLTDSDSTLSSDQGSQLPDTDSTVSSSSDDSEHMYEGKEGILDSAPLKFDVREPVFEGEVFLAEQSDGIEDFASLNSRKSQKEYHLIKNFLETSASQLTIYGLFCLQEGLEEKGLCVFFRNNHFSTLLKFKGELYLLATDEGYMNHPDLVWEKLNEVNGNTVFVTGKFRDFKIDNQVHDPRNNPSALTDIADFLGKVKGSEPASSLDSDHQLAIDLQKEEYEQRGRRRVRQTSQQQPPDSGGSSRIWGRFWDKTDSSSENEDL